MKFISALKITKTKILLILLILASGFGGYNYFFASKTNIKTDTARVKRGNLEEKLTISGTVDAEEKVTLRFQTSGRLNWIGVKEGDYVKKYQRVASLDQKEVKKKLQKEINDYLNSRWDFEQKNRDDYKDKVITDTIKRIKEKAQFDLNNAVLDVEIQNLSVELSYLSSPIEGIVTKISSPYAGINIIPSQAEFEIINPNTVFFSAVADQTEVVRVKEGMKGELTLDAFSESTLSGRIKNISFTPKSGETGTVYNVKFTFDNNNSDYKYRIGMGGDLTFVLKSKNDVLYLPIKYVKTENGPPGGEASKKYVKIKKNGNDQKTYVGTGMETDDEIEIIKGVVEGDTVTN